MRILLLAPLVLAAPAGADELGTLSGFVLRADSSLEQCYEAAGDVCDAVFDECLRDVDNDAVYRREGERFVVSLACHDVAVEDEAYVQVLITAATTGGDNAEDWDYLGGLFTEMQQGMSVLDW